MLNGAMPDLGSIVEDEPQLVPGLVTPRAEDDLDADEFDEDDFDNDFDDDFEEEDDFEDDLPDELSDDDLDHV